MIRLYKGLTSTLLLILGSFLFAVPLQVDYYGVVTSSADTSMLKMAQDVFFTQLNSIDNLSVTDKRPDLSKVLSALPDTSGSGNQKIIFYAEILQIKKSESETIWECTFKAKTPSDGKTYSNNTSFDSYYKILVNAKLSIENLLNPLKEMALETPSENADDFIPGKINLTLESFSGTWSGEPYADKIVILRGGRGFIIYKNGATMNIALSLEKDSSGTQKLHVKQTGKSNASFYPELSREIALTAAANASPIEWIFSISSATSLSGDKHTLIKSNTVPESASQGIQKVSWSKNQH